MTKDELRQQFIVDDDVLQARLEALITKALRHCVVDKRGVVHIKDPKIGGKERIKLALSARALASELGSEIKGVMTVEELALSTGVPREQVRARASDLVKEKFAESPSAGSFKAIPHKIESFLDGLTP